MPSNIRINKHCLNCQGIFVAQRTTTRYCSHKCNKQGSRKKELAILQQSNGMQSVEMPSLIPAMTLNEKPFLSVKDVARLLSFSVKTVYRLIEDEVLTGYRISPRKTIIKRSDLDLMFRKPDSVSGFYTITEIQTKYNIAKSTVVDIIKRNSIQRFKKGNFVFISIDEFDSIFNPRVWQK